MMITKKYSATLLISVLIAATCFGQQNEATSIEAQEVQQSEAKTELEREGRSSINVGAFMGGGGLVGADLELLLGKRVSLQMGAGILSFGCGVNYHFKPQINSSFVSLQYSHIGYGENYVGSTIGPMFTFRAKKIFQAGLGYGMVVDKGPKWEEAYKENVSILIHFNIGLYFPL